MGPKREGIFTPPTPLGKVMQQPGILQARCGGKQQWLDCRQSSFFAPSSMAPIGLDHIQSNRSAEVWPCQTQSQAVVAAYLGTSVARSDVT